MYHLLPYLLSQKVTMSEAFQILFFIEWQVINSKE